MCLSVETVAFTLMCELRARPLMGMFVRVTVKTSVRLYAVWQFTAVSLSARNITFSLKNKLHHFNHI